MAGLKHFAFVGFLALGMAAIGGCQDKGPAEKAGESVDKGVKKTGEAIENAGDKVKDATN